MQCCGGKGYEHTVLQHQHQHQLRHYCNTANHCSAKQHSPHSTCKHYCKRHCNDYCKHTQQGLMLGLLHSTICCGWGGGGLPQLAAPFGEASVTSRFHDKFHEQFPEQSHGTFHDTCHESFMNTFMKSFMHSCVNNSMRVS